MKADAPSKGQLEEMLGVRALPRCADLPLERVFSLFGCGGFCPRLARAGGFSDAAGQFYLEA